MAFNIILYKFNKKVNSTKLPVASTPSISLSCNIKTQSSIINPRVEIKENPIEYNYCYIEKFNRYYFINDITYNLGLWVLDLNVDVLGSFKTNILTSTQYVARSFSDYNRNIIDNIYPLKAEHTATTNIAKGSVINSEGTALQSYFGRNYDGGYFVISVLSDNATGVTYYGMYYSSFKNFVQALMNYIPSDFTDVSDGIAKSVFDPMQYINGCNWYSDLPTNISELQTSINIGGYSITVSGGFWEIEEPIERYSILIDIPKHPQSNTYYYLNTEPYTFYNLIFEPFGTISIDASKIYGANELKLEWLVDYGTNTSRLNIINNSLNLILDTLTGAFGVNIPISQITTDILGGINSGINTIGGIVGSALTGNVVGAIGSAFSGVGSMFNSIKPMLSTTGSNGSFINYWVGKPKLIANFYYEVNKDALHYGEPLCEYKVLNTLNGYCLCDNASIEADNITGNEKEQIESYLNGGFYIE